MVNDAMAAALRGEGGGAFRPAPMLGQRVTEVLRRMIISGELATETHLVEAQLSEHFGLSRGPVRDALRQLEREGLVESRRRGVFVLGLSEDDINELYDLRDAIENKVMSICCDSDRDVLPDAHESLERMKQAAEVADNHAFTQADLDFHSAFYVAAGNRRILDMWVQYRPTYAMMMDLATDEPVDLDPICLSHQKLYEATISGDQKTLDELLRSHLEASKTRLVAAHSRLNPKA